MFLRPELLRLEGDAFMDVLVRAAALQATERDAALAPLRLSADTPKLFQPVHGHYTVVLASLVCQLPGLPEHAVGAKDRVGMVLRRKVGEAETAWIPSVSGTNPPGRWATVATPEAFHVEPDGTEEEVLPLFPLAWADAGRTRRAWAGIVPIAAREAYEGAGITLTPTPTAETLKLTWQGDLESRVLAVIDGLVAAKLKADAETEETVTRFVLLDLADLLEGIFGAGWLATTPAQGLSAWSRLDTTPVPRTDGTSPSTFRQACIAARDHRAELVSTGTWAGAPKHNLALFTGAATLRSGLTADLTAAGLPAATAAAPASLPKVSSTSGVYVVRCVYLRPPCGIRSTSLISKPSLPFRMAAFLDLDAPQRETRITLPTDTSIAGLRKLKKSVGIVMSAAMRAKTEAASVKETLEGEEVSVPSLQIGWITVWSIPILTICATILLMIIAALLNLVFWWLPFLRITIPVVTVEEE